MLQTVMANEHGEKTVVLELDCKDNKKAIVFLNACARHDAHHPDTRTLALDLRRSSIGDRPVDAGHATQAVAEGVMLWVRAHVSFIPETDEVFQAAQWTAAHGAGDCDDHARLVAALLIASGEKARVVGVPKANGAIAHVAPQVLDGKVWQWCETTVAARYGEHPFAAAVRLGILKKRPDIG